MAETDSQPVNVGFLKVTNLENSKCRQGSFRRLCLCVMHEFQTNVKVREVCLTQEPETN